MNRVIPDTKRTRIYGKTTDNKDVTLIVVGWLVEENSPAYSPIVRLDGSIQASTLARLLADNPTIKEDSLCAYEQELGISGHWL